MTNNLRYYIYLSGFRTLSEFARAIGKTPAWVSYYVYDTYHKPNEATREWLVKKINEYMQKNLKRIKENLPVKVEDVFPVSDEQPIFDKAQNIPPEAA